MKHLHPIFLLLMILLVSGCSSASKEPIHKTGFYFDTIITITIYDKKDNSLLEDCFAFCDKIEKQISRTIPESDISRINNAGGSPTEVSATTIELLEQAISYSKLTNGAFDVTVAPLSTLWDFKNNPGNVPTEAEISEALSHVNYKNIIIEKNTVTLKDSEAAIDLGGIAKGYIADSLKTYLLKNGVNSAIINLGGNILTIGTKPDGSPFQIGIQKPFDKQEKTITSVSSIDSSVVTSGSYERYFKVDDNLYHHILDTRTGYPCNNDLLSVTILSEDSVVGDALSTACFTMGLDAGMDFIKSLDNVEAIFITEAYEIFYSQNTN